ncbi:uncharacterized protein LOC112449917 [Kryptolebias marmoratus]|uniref:uncharacterized protein LOC112449917 n=1 Tax=Kryptolebias marmoratus TaxID=37003 RepID=UPI0018ACA585|nr:uncharacterized protein LOC112449917 [Kryptolebias marmoratus]XP_037837912.1 uncharacterized protein LOC112449917 [Kryptolebias marmoratus]
MLIFESNSLETVLVVVVVLVLVLLWLNVTTVTDFVHATWDHIKSAIPGGNHAYLIIVSILMILMFLLGLFSLVLLVFGIVMLSFHWLNVTIVTDSFRSAWNHFQAENDANILVASILMMLMFVFGLISSAVLVIGVVLLSFHWLNVTIVTDLFESSWNHFKSVFPGENPPKIIGASVLLIMLFVFGSVSSVLVFGVGILSVHLLNPTILTDSFTSGWNRIKDEFPGENHARMLAASVLMIMLFVFGSVSSAVLVIGVLIFSSQSLSVTIVTESFRSGWNHVRSIFQGEHLVKMLEETTLTIKRFIFESRLSVTLLVLVVLVVSILWLNFTILTDLFISGWSFLRSVVPGLFLVETLGASTLTITTFVFGSYSSTVLVVGVLILSVHLITFTTGWNRFRPVTPGGNPAKIFVPSTVTITIFIFGSVSSALFVISVLIFSPHFLNVTTVRDYFNLFWNHFSSVISDSILEMVDGRSGLANVVKEKSALLTPQTGSLPVYKIPLKEKQTDSKGYKYFRFGKKSTKPNRTIVVLGAAGAGKSTVISGMINYILGVKWEDSYRFKLVDEDQVTVYKIYHQKGFKINYSLTIVDTPGFGDTRDGEVSEQLRKLFYSLLDFGEIDAVCFVAQASLTQLTPTQKHMFDSILSIFGKDVAENIRILVTFADDQLPPVLEAIRVSGVSCPRTKDGLPVYFKFNSSALFADNTSAAGSTSGSDTKQNSYQMFWHMGTSSMMSFFTALVCMKTIRLTLTDEVLGGRQQVESSVENLQMQVKLGLAKLEKIKETIGKVKEHEAEISRN